MTLGENTIQPLEIQDARMAEHEASRLQAGVEDRMREASKDLAEKERAYRQLLSERILKLKAGGAAITACETIAKGEPEVANLRYARDVAKGIWEATRQESFRRGADRAAVGRLVDWSMRRDLRTDAPPAQLQAAIGSVRAA